MTKLMGKFKSQSEECKLKHRIPYLVQIDKN